MTVRRLLAGFNSRWGYQCGGTLRESGACKRVSWLKPKPPHQLCFVVRPAGAAMRLLASVTVGTVAGLSSQWFGFDSHRGHHMLTFHYVQP